MRYLYCFAVVNSFVVQQAAENNNQIENSLTETLTTMVSLSLQMCSRNWNSPHFEGHRTSQGQGRSVGFTRPFRSGRFTEN